MRRFFLPVVGLLWALGAAGCGDDGASGPKPRTMTRLDVMRGCLASDACGVFRYSYLERCVASRYEGAFRSSQAAIWAALFDCVSEAGGDCEAVRRCYGGGEVPPSCRAVTDGYCDGDVQVTCDVIDGKLYRLDCALAAEQCSMASMPSGDLVPVCGYGACNPEEFTVQCRGNLRLVCDSGYISIRDCSQDGKVCREGECVQDAHVCAARPQCDGQVLVTCLDGHKNLTDCSAVPGDMACDDQAAACVPVTSPCQDGEEACEGTVARLCHNGLWMEVDCRDLGFAGCSIKDAGVHCTR